MVVTRAIMVDVFVFAISAVDAVSYEGACGVDRTRGVGRIALGLSSRARGVMMVTDGVCVV